MSLCWILILACIIHSSTQTIFMCNSNASCGCSTNSTTTINRIISGETAETDAWAWTVSVSIQRTYLCGGSLLSSSWVITAAHCVDEANASQIIIYAGSNLRWSGTQARKGLRIIVHQNYNPSTFANDIALIEVVFPFDMTDRRLRTVCLPSVSSTILASGEWPVVNTSVVAVGWGRLVSNGSSSLTLQQVTLEIIDYRVITCSSVMNDRRVQLCAGVANGTKDTCSGDSGGPLMMFSSTRQWVLIGLTSYGYGCAQPEATGVYTRVAAYQDWINSMMNTAHNQRPSIFYLFLIILNQIRFF